jgi:DNA (cytosine-5)-methyltransferase 1
MNFATLFSGIGGFDLGLERAGMTCAWQCEIDKAARKVLALRFPDVPCLEDVCNVTSSNVAAVDLVCGGFPCQDLSVAGKRAGLAGERSGLWFQFRRVLDELRPQWVVIENVPGLLSSNGGRDFAVLLRGLVELRYGVCWRILDAQYFGVAQRRRRVFIVGSLGDGRAAQVLFESEGVQWDSPPRRETRQAVARSLAPGAHPGSYNGRDAERGMLVTTPIAAHHPRNDLDNETYICEPRTFDWQADVASSIMDKPGRTRSLSARRTLAVYGGNNTAGPIDVATACNAHGGTGRMDFESETFIAYNLSCIPSGVRRLTPTECERLQGFPDGWTAGAGQSDSARYRQLGNAVCVPVAEWIGRRITTQVIPPA